MGFFARLGVHLGLGNWRMRVAWQFQDNTTYIHTRPMAQL